MPKSFLRSRAEPRASTRPGREQLAAARDKSLPDVIAPDLQVLFVGINPGLYSSAVGHHFARPGNRFWPALAAAGFTQGQLSPFSDRELLEVGLGITNLVARTTARADELSREELTAGAARLAQLAAAQRPRVVAVVGVSAYRLAFQRPRAQLGLQGQKLADAALWVLPNPSGLNAHHQLPALARLFGELHAFCAPVPPPLEKGRR